MKYKFTVVSCINLQSMCDTVERMLNAGWQLHGETRQVVLNQYSGGNPDYAYTQPMLQMIPEDGE